MRRTIAWRLRRIAVVGCVALIVAAVLMFLNVQISVVDHGTQELIGGQANDNALALPLALFVVGAVGLMAALGWRPRP